MLGRSVPHEIGYLALFCQGSQRLMKLLEHGLRNIRIQNRRGQRWIPKYSIKWKNSRIPYKATTISDISQTHPLPKQSRKELTTLPKHPAEQAPWQESKTASHPSEPKPDKPHPARPSANAAQKYCRTGNGPRCAVQPIEPPGTI